MKKARPTPKGAQSMELLKQSVLRDGEPEHQLPSKKINLTHLLFKRIRFFKGHPFRLMPYLNMFSQGKRNDIIEELRRLETPDRPNEPPTCGTEFHNR